MSRAGVPGLQHLTKLCKDQPADAISSHFFLRPGTASAGSVHPEEGLRRFSFYSGLVSAY
jgi:hypothetical protein